MSAYVVARETIDVIVRYALVAGRDQMRWTRQDEEGTLEWMKLDRYASGEDESLRSPSQVGQMLLDENLRSVGFRYPDTDAEKGDMPGPNDPYYVGPYVYADPRYTLTQAELYKAIDRLEYQSCEHPGWERSEALSFLMALRDRCCARTPGYEDAPWGWSETTLRERLSRGAV